jgi:hypothetical protein
MVSYVGPNLYLELSVCLSSDLEYALSVGTTLPIPNPMKDVLLRHAQFGTGLLIHDAVLKHKLKANKV